MQTLILVIIVISFLFLNAFFIASEFALVRLRGTYLEAIKKEHNFRSRLLIRMHQNLDVHLSVCQFGITLATLGLGWIGEPTFAKVFELIFLNPYIAIGLGTFVSFAIAFLFIAYLHIVIGELAPKSLAIRKPEQVASFIAVPLYFFYLIIFPIIWLLNISAKGILKIFGVTEPQKEPSYSLKELKLILNASHLHEDLTKEDLQILSRVLDFTGSTVGDLMKPIHEMQALSTKQTLSEVSTVILGCRFSRYPIYNTEQTKIIGLFDIKGLLPYLMHNDKLPPIEKLKCPIMLINQNIPAIDLFQQFREQDAHFAVVVNEAGDYVGFITLDDILRASLTRNFNHKPL
jgi:CBS domain containing-hemolysin-like protein